MLRAGYPTLLTWRGGGGLVVQLLLTVYEDCVSLEKLRKFPRVVHVLCAQCALGFKMYGKVRKLEWYITKHSIPVWVLTSRHTEYEYLTGIAEIYSSSTTGSDIHYRMLATMVLLTFLLKCCMMIQQERIMQDVYTFAVARVLPI